MSISAKVVAHSVNNHGIEITTLVLKYPRYIHSEFMTHRVFSRNASSSRAIPVLKCIEAVKSDPVEPIWVKNQPGMQADHLLDGSDLKDASLAWDLAREQTINHCRFLVEVGVHKQIINRMLEPFSHITVIVTSTEWENFFNLRITPHAQQEICELATCMRDAIKESTPEQLDVSQWHLPFVTEGEKEIFMLETQKQLSVGRNARVSYLNHDKSSPDIYKDKGLHDQLLSSRHMSPFEHIATPGLDTGFCANFRGWKQYRWEVENEV